MDFYQHYGYTYSEPEQTVYGAGVMVAVICLILLLACLIGLAGYILKGIGLYTMAKRQGKAHPWMAFVPVIRRYLQGELSGDITFKTRTLRDTPIWFAMFPVIFGVVYSAVTGIASLVGGVTLVTVFLPYSRPYIGAGRAAVLLLLVLIFVVVTIAYEALYKTFRVMVNSRIYKNATSESMAVAHAVLGVLIPLYESICFFVLRNKTWGAGTLRLDVDDTKPETESSEPENVGPQSESDDLPDVIYMPGDTGTDTTENTSVISE